MAITVDDPAIRKKTSPPNMADIPSFFHGAFSEKIIKL